MKQYSKIMLILIMSLFISACGMNLRQNEYTNIKKNENIDVSKIKAENLLLITVNDKLGYIDREGNVIIEPQFESATKFNNGLAVIWENKDSKGRYINMVIR